MPIAGALIVPVKMETAAELQVRLSAVAGINIEDIGPKGIAIVLEADSTRELKEISADIEQWDDVLEFELAYLNWEDVIE